MPQGFFGRAEPIPPVAFRLRAAGQDEKQKEI